MSPQSDKQIASSSERWQSAVVPFLLEQEAVALLWSLITDAMCSIAAADSAAQSSSEKGAWPPPSSATSTRCSSKVRLVACVSVSACVFVCVCELLDSPQWLCRRDKAAWVSFDVARWRPVSAGNNRNNPSVGKTWSGRAEMCLDSESTRSTQRSCALSSSQMWLRDNLLTGVIRGGSEERASPCMGKKLLLTFCLPTKSSLVFRFQCCSLRKRRSHSVSAS